jgi:hypothetical protein
MNIARPLTDRWREDQLRPFAAAGDLHTVPRFGPHTEAPLLEVTDDLVLVERVDSDLDV